MYNALIVNDSGITKIFVDFSNFDNIYESLKVRRISTIHTRETQRISSILGVHLMGFVDRDCAGPNNKKACEISGYDYLGADLLLCKTDDKFNPLPLEEDELERVYKYLLNGKEAGNPYEKSTSGGEKRVNVEDSIEEAIDDETVFAFTPINDIEEEYLIGYFLMMDFDAKWVESEDDYSFKSKNCIPLDCFLEEEIKPYVINFKNFIEIVAVDLDNKVVKVKVNGNVNCEYVLKLDESITINFDYFGRPKERSTHRVGAVTLTFRYIEIESDVVKGMDNIELTYTQHAREREIYRTVEALKVDNGLDNREMVSLPDGMRYGIYIISEDRNDYILYAVQSDSDEDFGMLYIPFNRKNGITTIFEEEYKEGLKRMKRTTELYYDEYKTN